MTGHLLTGSIEGTAKWLEGAAYKDHWAIWYVLILELSHSFEITPAMLARAWALTTVTVMFQLVTGLGVCTTEVTDHGPLGALVSDVILKCLSVLWDIAPWTFNLFMTAACLVLSHDILNGSCEWKHLDIQQSDFHLLQDFPFFFIPSHVCNDGFTPTQRVSELVEWARMNSDACLAEDVSVVIFETLRYHSIAGATDKLRL